MRFLVDENLPRVLKHAIEELGHDVVLVWRSDLRGEADSEIAAYAIKENRILITRDLDFPIPGAHALPGLVLLRAPDAWGGEDLARLATDVIRSAGGRIQGHIVVVSPGRIRWRRMSDG